MLHRLSTSDLDTSEEGMEIASAHIVARRAVIAGGVLLLAYGFLFVLGQEQVDTYVEEDGVVETLGACLLLVGSAFFALTFIRRCRTGAISLEQVVLLLLAIAFFFGAGEEISWGQRLFGLDTPSGLENANAQKELNVHNLDALDGWLNVDRLFQVFWLVLGVVIPIAAARSDRLRIMFATRLPVFPVWVATLLIANQLIAELATVMKGIGGIEYNGTVAFEQARFEVTETMVAAILAIGAFALWKASRLLDEVSSPPTSALTTET